MKVFSVETIQRAKSQKSKLQQKRIWDAYNQFQFKYGLLFDLITAKNVISTAVWKDKKQTNKQCIFSLKWFALTNYICVAFPSVYHLALHVNMYFVFKIMEDRRGICSELSSVWNLRNGIPNVLHGFTFFIM